MTDIDSAQCPACGADQINTEAPLDGGICGDCGYVMHPDSEEEPPSINRDAVEVGARSGSNLEWKKRLSVKDSSDENIIRLVEKTDRIGQELLVDKKGRTLAVEHAVDAWADGFTHGRTLCVVAGATIDLASRELEKARPTSVVADVSDVNVNCLTRTRRDLAGVLEVNLPVPHPVEYVPFICRSADLTHLTEDTQQVLRNKESLPAGDPAGVAGGAIYLMLESTNESLSYKEVGNIVGLTKETVWKQADKLRK